MHFDVVPNWRRTSFCQRVNSPTNVIFWPNLLIFAAEGIVLIADDSVLPQIEEDHVFLIG